MEEVLGEGDAAGLEDGDGGGSAECEVAFFVGFFDGLMRGVGLMDGADAGGTDFEDENGAEVLGFELAEGAFVLPEVGEIF